MWKYVERCVKIAGVKMQSGSLLFHLGVFWMEVRLLEKGGCTSCKKYRENRERDTERERE